MQKIGERLKSTRDEEGVALIEMAIACGVLLALLVGIVQAAQALYVYNFVSEAAREGTRYAAVRGADSCTNALGAMPDCNLGPTSSGNAIQAYLRGLGFPYANGVTASTTWVSPTGGSGSPVVWDATNNPCTTATDTNANSLLKGDPCNYPGHAVQVHVACTYSLGIPFWKIASLNINSTSQMVIND
jgi:hypothetical protein